MRERLWILLGKKVSGEIDPAELQELERLLRQSGDTTVSGELMERLWHAPLAPLKAGDDTEEENWKAISGAIVTQAPVHSITRPWLWAAASVALLVLAGAGGYWWALHPSRTTQTSVNVLATRPDSRSKITLPDGTTVWLNSDSRVTYPNAYGEKTREITLDGEAFFDVARDPRIPMIVHAKGVDIQVLGTTFNVRAYPQDSQVVASLVTGEIALSDIARPGWRVVLKPHEKLLASPVASKVDTLHTEPRSQTIPEVAWVSGKFSFYREPFGSLADRMGRWYRVQVRITDKSLEQQTLTGVFEKESLEQALTALQVTCRFHYVIREDTVLINR